MKILPIQKIIELWWRVPIYALLMLHWCCGLT